MNFMRKSMNLYMDMGRRFGPKYSRGKLVDPGRDLPFTVAEFRRWVQAQEVCTGVVRCRACRAYITFFTAGLDHSYPVSRGGSIDLDNLNLDYCQDCNRKKGSLTIEEFDALLAVLDGFPTEAKKDVLDRLSSGGIGHFAALARMKYRMAGKRKAR